MEETSLYVYYYTYLPFFYHVSNMNMSFSRPKVYLKLLNEPTKYVSIIGSIHIRHLLNRICIVVVFGFSILRLWTKNCIFFENIYNLSLWIPSPSSLYKFERFFFTLLHSLILLPWLDITERGWPCVYVFCCFKHFLEDPQGAFKHRKMSKNQKCLPLTAGTGWSRWISNISEKYCGQHFGNYSSKLSNVHHFVILGSITLIFFQKSRDIIFYLKFIPSIWITL